MSAPLHHELVTPSGPAPSGWLLVTHGIYGSGGNWRTVARRLVERRPRWGVVLVDLRGHGRSPAGAPPHSIDACARDLAALDAAMSAAGRPVRAALGHSFGGKVALALRRLTAHAPGATARATDLLQTWVVDATPTARPGAFDAPDNTVREVLELLERLPPRLPTREALVAAVVAGGHPESVGAWLATNLDPAPGPDGGFRLRLDLGVVRALLRDYYETDLWPAVEDPHMPGELRVVVAGRSTSVPHADRERLLSHQAHTGLTLVHEVPDAGHWIHVDAPAAMVELLAGALPAI